MEVMGGEPVMPRPNGDHDEPFHSPTLLSEVFPAMMNSPLA
jgi:hypothetical protein